MLSYLQFILENKDKFRLYYSLKFRTILEKIKSINDNEIADILLQSENNNMYQGKFTLIDITDKNDFISFIQTNRILRKNPDLNSDWREQGILPNEISLGSNDFWKTGRTEMAIGRWTRKVFSDILQKSRSSMILDNNELEEFVNQYKATYDSLNNVKLELVEGEKIRHWYSEKNYESRMGQLGNSCMKQPEKSNFFDIYVNNPDVCKLLILKSDDDDTKIKGRALIWKLDDGSYYQDRVYTNNESDRTLFENWAREKDMSRFWNDSGLNMTVQLGDYKYDKYPYMDTFVVYNPDTKQLKNDEGLWPGQGYYLLQHTNGGFRNDEVVWSEYEQEYIDIEDAVLTVDDEWVPRIEAIYVESRDEWFSPYDDNVVWSEWSREHFHIDDVVHSDLLNSWLPSENDKIIEINGQDDDDYVPKDRIDLYFEHEGLYYSRQHWIKNPYDDNKLMNLYSYTTRPVTLNTTRNSSLLMSKLESELGNDNEKVKRKIFEIFINNNYNKADVLNSINNNQIFKNKISGVYWGLSREDVPTADLMIPIILASIYSGSVVELYDNLKLYGSEYREIFWKWNRYDRRLINLIYKFSKSFDFSSFNDIIYKAWLYFNI